MPAKHWSRRSGLAVGAGAVLGGGALVLLQGLGASRWERVVAAVVGPTPVEAPPGAAPVLRNAAFLAMQGINTHMNYTDGAYAKVDMVLETLRYLGVNRIRDNLITPNRFGAPGTDTYVRMARAGVKFTFIIGGSMDSTRSTPEHPSMAERIGYVREVLQQVPGSVVAVEGTNEINNWPVTFDGLGPPHVMEAALAMQRALYASIRKDPHFTGVPVYYLTGYGMGSVPQGPDPAAVPGLADFNTQHPYPNHGDPPALWVSRKVALSNTRKPDAPAVYTETGYNTKGGTNGGVDDAVQAAYTLALLLDAAKQQIAATYLYELLDAYPPGAPQGNEGFGLFDANGQPKPAARMIRAMNQILADPGPHAEDFPIRPLRYVVEGQSSAGNHMALQRSDGATFLALWDETPIWDGKTGKPLPEQKRRVQISLQGTQQADFALFDPARGTDPVLRSAGQDVHVELGGHALFLRITPVAAAVPDRAGTQRQPSFGSQR